MSLQRALLLLIATALLAGIVPAGIIIENRLSEEVEARARDDLALAPARFVDRNATQAEAMLMHAKDLARAPGLLEAIHRRDKAAALRAIESARNHFGDGSVLVDARGVAWSGPAPDSAILLALARGESATMTVVDSGALHVVTLVPLTQNGAWLGGVGIRTALGRSTAGTLAALTRADVLIFGPNRKIITGTPADSVLQSLAPLASPVLPDGQVHLITSGQEQYLVTASAAGSVGTIAFVRDLTRDLAVLPRFRRLLILSGVAAVLLGLLLGTIVARRIAQPVIALADAADRLAAGDNNAPLMRSSIREISRLSDAFAAMRSALSIQISDVTGANRRLTDRQARMESSQGEILQRERMAVSSRLVAELSHEIRNPIANLRNCLEIIRRRVQDDPQGREFTDLAIDELLRMHELAEQLLDLNRPRDPTLRIANVDTVIREVGVLASVGGTLTRVPLEIEHTETKGVLAAIAPDALKQVLLNLVQNAREALNEVSAGRVVDAEISAGKVPRISIASRVDADRVVISVADNGPGIPTTVLPRIFDPFFTTKGAVHGVGLGLFVAEGLVRGTGGRMTVENQQDGGVTFHVELPIVPS